MSEEAGPEDSYDFRQPDSRVVSSTRSFYAPTASSAMLKYRAAAH